MSSFNVSRDSNAAVVQASAQKPSAVGARGRSAQRHEGLRERQRDGRRTRSLGVMPCWRAGQRDGCDADVFMRRTRHEDSVGTGLVSRQPWQVRQGLAIKQEGDAEQEPCHDAARRAEADGGGAPGDSWERVPVLKPRASSCPDLPARPCWAQFVSVHQGDLADAQAASYSGAGDPERPIPGAGGAIADGAA